MSFIVFILLGLAVSAFTHALFNRRPSAVMMNLGVSAIGAVMAGALFKHVAAAGAAVLGSADALVAAVTGAVVLLAAYHAMLGWMRDERPDGESWSDAAQDPGRASLRGDASVERVR